MAEVNNKQLIEWFDQVAKPFFEKNAPEKLPSLLSDRNRLEVSINRPEEIVVCFLGNSAVGKSTLINALVADTLQILPAGGSGPMTALATEVSFSELKKFKVSYHSKIKLLNMIRAFDMRIRQETKSATNSADQSADALLIDLAELDAVSDIDVISELNEMAMGSTTDIEGNSVVDPMETIIGNARKIITGNQFSQKSLEYLAEGLRLCCGYKTKNDQHIEEDDLKRIERVKSILTNESKNYERQISADQASFMEDLNAHSAGFLTPMIERIEVGWPSPLLRSGVRLVDLPGVGIAQDSFRDVTKSYVKEKSRAVILVVDKSGPTESTIELLRSSGYWEKLVGSSYDAGSDPCAMLIAVTKVDEGSDSLRAFKVQNLEEGQKRPTKREVYAEYSSDLKIFMRDQVVQQLATINDSSNETVNEARKSAKQTILESLEIHPVSAPQFRKILAQDEEDEPFLKDITETGIPDLKNTLNALSISEMELLKVQREEISKRLSGAIVNELSILKAQWTDESRAVEEAQYLQASLDLILAPLREEYQARKGSFRRFLDDTVQEKIHRLVLEAKIVAEDDIREYLGSLRQAHWGTLKAAVRRGGAYDGSRHINLPDDITSYFQDPMAAVWGQKLLVDMRKETTNLAEDINQMVGQICQWARENENVKVQPALLNSQQERIKGLVEQMKTVGKEAVKGLKDAVQNELSKHIREQVRKACKKFVDRGDHVGQGVKSRILDLFEKLASESTQLAVQPAIEILQTRAKEVRDEILKEFKKGGEPLQDTVDVIVQKHADRIKRSDDQKRKTVLLEIDSVTNSCPM
jgi:GTP-binding protein EngB required for normal cell division